MPTYIMLSTLTPEGVQTIKNNPQRIREVNHEVEQLGATVKAQWATLGHFDFVNVVEAPDEKTIARVSLELGSRGTGQVRDADRDPDRRLHRLRSEPPRVLVVGAGGARARDRPARCCARRSGPSCSARPATPGSPPRSRVLDVGVDDVDGLVAAAQRGRSTSSSSGPRRRSSPGSPTRWRGRDPRASARAPRRPRAGGLEGVLQGGDGAPPACRRPAYAVVTDPQAGHGGDRPLPGGDQGRRARRRQGRGHRRGRGAGARGARRLLVERRFGTERGGGRGAPRRRGAVAAGAVRRRARAAAGARRRTTSGSSTATRGPTPAAWAPTRRCRASTPSARPRSARACTSRSLDELRAPRHPVPRRALRGPDADRRRAEACSSSTSASAIPRRRRSCRGCAPTCSSCSSGADRAGRPGGRRARVDAATRPSRVVLASARLPRERRPAAT